MKAQYGDMPASAILTLMGSRFQGASDALNSLNNTKTYLQADYNMALDMATGHYKAVSQDIAEKSQFRQQIQSKVANSLLSLATMREEQKVTLEGKKMEAEYMNQVAQEAMNDPTTAVSAMIEEYKKMGIPFQRSTLSMIQEAQDYVAKGGNLADYLTNLNKTIQTKPEYQRMMQAKAPEIQNIQNPDGTVSQMTWNGSNWVPVNANQQMLDANISGVDVVKALASGNYNGSNFFGVYATDDPQGTQRASIYNTINQQGLDAYMQRVVPN